MAGKRISWIFLVVLISGCSWFGDKDKEEKRKPTPLQRINQEVKLNKVWDRRIGAGAEDTLSRLTPGISGERIFASSVDGRVLCMELKNGKKIWEVKVADLTGQGSKRFFSFGEDEDVISGGVGVGYEMVVVGTTAGDLIAFNQTDGSLAWRAVLTSETVVPPQINSDIVVVQTIDGKISAFDVLDGEKKWTYSTNVPVLTLRGTSTPILTDRYVIAGFANGRVVLLDAKGGVARWEQRVAEAQGRSELERLVDVDGNLVLIGNTVYASSYQGSMVAIDMDTGRIRWRKDASSFAGVAEGFGNVYLAHDDSRLTAFDMESSRDVWEIDSLLYREISTPVPIGNHIAVGDLKGYVHLIAQSDGRFAGRRKVDGEAIRSLMLARGNTLYVQGNSGRLAAFRIE